MKISRRAFALGFAPSLAVLAACQPKTPPETKAAGATATTAPGIDLAGMDKTVKPGDDFFAYANGAWDKATEIPADRSSWGVSAKLAEESDAAVAELIKGATTAAPGSEARKVGDYYSTFMDEAGIEKLGLEPMKPHLARIAALTSKTDLATELGGRLRADVDALNNTNFSTPNLFGLWVEQDLVDPTRYTAYLLQGGLGLPDRDFYLSTKPKMVENRAAYQAHLARVLTLTGAADADAQAKRIFDLETKIAKVHATRADSEDVDKGNNPWKRADFAKKAPGLDWDAYFKAAGLSSQNDFVVWHPGATKGEAALVASEPLAVWKEYLALRLFERHARVLPKAFGDERFAFFEKTLRGTPQPQARWKQGVAATSAGLGQAVGKLYVDKYFPADLKAKIQGMVQEILAAFGKRIDSLDWMAPPTKAEAKKKLSTLKVGVGYPDNWIDYSGLQVVVGDPLGNAERASLFDYQRNIAKLSKPVDRGEWAMNPQLVNAVNLPIKNALNFPAAYLQPPHFDARNPAAMNYGSIGATIGHEISHSFDDQGSKFDSAGALRNWWTPGDLAHFKASGKALADQYSAYKPFPDLALNGEQVLSENIADIAGLNAAYDAYRAANGGKEGPAQQGLSGDQQFFLAFAQSWRTKAREAALRQQIVTDGHAPAAFRALTVRNMDAWYPAFGVQPGEKLYLAEPARVRVW